MNKQQCIIHFYQQNDSKKQNELQQNKVNMINKKIIIKYLIVLDLPIIFDIIKEIGCGGNYKMNRKDSLP